MTRRKKKYLKYKFEDLIGSTLNHTINSLNNENNKIFIIKKTKGSNEKFNQNKLTPIVVRIRDMKDNKVEIVVTYF
jgi:type II secretory pathway component HofQ